MTLSPVHCARCVLPSTFPGISFNHAGLCNFCVQSLDGKGISEKLDAIKNEIRTLVSGGKRRAAQYDVIVAYSGGKDSTYTLGLMTRYYGAKCLAVTIDNGFVSDQAWKNCNQVMAALCVDHMVFRPASTFMNNMYRRSVEDPSVHVRAAVTRASAICNSCINLINNYMIKVAIQNGVSVVAGGYIGGQVPRDSALMELDLTLLRKIRKNSMDRYVQHFGPEAKGYFELPRDKLGQDTKIAIINPMLAERVSEEEIIADISKLGWSRPTDTGTNSSNCRLNDLGIALHYKQFGFNPYVFEIAEQVRNGLTSREEGFRKANAIPEFKDVAAQAKVIGLRIDGTT